jgi:hypothetical protein
LILIILVGLGLLTWYLLKPYDRIDIANAIPSKPVFIIETDNSYEAWKKLTSNEVWGSLKKHPFFSSIGKGVDVLDTLIQSKEKISKYIGSRNMLISMHITGRGTYDFIYVIDIRRVSKLLAAQNFIEDMVAAKFKLKIRKYNDVSVFMLVDTASKKTLQMYLKKNLLVASYNQKLIEASMDHIDKPYVATDTHFTGIRDKVKGGLFRLYINYAQLDDYTNGMLSSPDPNIRQLSESLYYTGLSFDIDNDNMIQCEGYTNFNDSIPSSFRAMMHSGEGKTGLAEVLPVRTASSVSMGFDRFTDYFDNLMTNLKEVPKSYNSYQANIKQAENYLNIDVRKNLMNWIGDEAAMVHLAPMGLGRSNEFAVFLKTRDMDDAKKNMDIVMEQIRKRTPAKFQTVEYNGYNINYLSIKGFFRMLLGKYFQKLDKPYFTYIGDYVVFSNHPQTLKVIIDGFAKNTLLSNLSDYKSFTKNFSRKSSVLMLVNTSQFFQSLQGMVTPATWTELQTNKEYIVSFPYFGFQMEKDGSLFKTRLYITFKGANSVENDQPFVDTTEESPEDSVGIVVTDQVADEVSKMLSQTDDYVPENTNAPVYAEKYPNGKLKVEFDLKDGFRDGDYKEYYDNGNLKIKGQYKKDHKNGVWKLYALDGKLLQKIKFEDGKRK